MIYFHYFCILFKIILSQAMRGLLFLFLLNLVANSALALMQTPDAPMLQDSIKKKKKRVKKTSEEADNTIQFLDFETTPTPAAKVLPPKDTLPSSAKIIPENKPVVATVKDYINYKSYGVILPPNAKAITYKKDENGNMQGSIEAVDIKQIRNAKLTKEQKNYQYSMFYLNRGVVMLNLQDYGEAVKYLKKSLKKDKNNKEALLLRGNAYTETDEYSKAIKDFNKAMKLDSSDATLYYNRANTLIKLDRHKEAMSDLTTAINMKPDYLYAYMGRASLRTLVKDFSGAIDDYTVVLDMNQFYITARRGRGVTYAFMQQWDRAESDFEQILDHLPNDGLSFYYLGLINIKQNDMISGCTYLKKAEKLDIAVATEALKAYCK
jgi:tetratricopeptide (TPR) repeat protein